MTKLKRREAIKVFLVIEAFLLGLGVPTALYIDNRNQQPLCAGYDADLMGSIISTRPLPETRYYTEYLGSAFYKTNKTSYIEYSSLYLYLERNGTGLFVSDQPGLRNESEWYIHETKEYGIVEVCIKFS